MIPLSSHPKLKSVRVQLDEVKFSGFRRTTFPHDTGKLVGKLFDLHSQLLLFPCSFALFFRSSFSF